jgi:hypothetical protein
VDTEGLPMRVDVHSALIQDRDGAVALGFGANLPAISLDGDGRAIVRQQQKCWLAAVTLGIVERRLRIHRASHSS